MPSGVEHADKATWPEIQEMLITVSMPSGVEHSWPVSTSGVLDP